MTYALLLLAFALPVAYATHTSIRQGKIEVNHVTLFSLGYVAYWVLPIALGLMFKEQLDGVVATLWTDTLADAGHFDSYLIYISFIYVAFAAGDWLANRGSKQTLRPPTAVSRKVLIIFAVIGLVITVAETFRAREILLQGQYVTETASENTRGGVVGASNFLFAVAVMYVVQSKPKRVKDLLVNPFLLCWWPIGLIILLSGTRLNFISLMLMLLVYWTACVRPIALRSFIAVLCASALLAGLVGVYRMRSGNVFANILTEPLYTSISLLIVLARGDSHLARVPIYLGSDLINLVPGILLPNKERLMQEIPDVYSPLGAINSYVSFEANFGVLGTAVFIFLFAWGTRRLRRTPGSWRTPAYVMISGWSGFALFRDPFAVSLVKDILEFSILMPAAICALSFWLRWSCGVAPGGVNISAAKQVDQGS